MVWRFIGMMKRRKEDDFESVTNLATDNVNGISSDKEKEIDKILKGTDLEEKDKTKVNLREKS
jgi:hypothetical protein